MIGDNGRAYRPRRSQIEAGTNTGGVPHLRVVKIGLLAFLLLMTALFVTGCEPPSRGEVIGILLILAYLVMIPVCAIVCPIIAYIKWRRWREVVLGFTMGLCLSFVGLFLLLILAAGAKRQEKTKGLVRDAVKAKAVFLWNPPDMGIVREKYGTLFLSDTGVVVKLSSSSIRFPAEDIDCITVHDYLDAERRFPNELSASRIGNASVVEVRPRVKRNQQYYLFMISQEAAQQILTKLNASAGWQ